MRPWDGQKTILTFIVLPKSAERLCTTIAIQNPLFPGLDIKKFSEIPIFISLEQKISASNRITQNNFVSVSGIFELQLNR
jgi:hypothetical protein